MKDCQSTSLKVLDQQLMILDQQLLPDQEIWINVENPDHMVQIIKDLKVRGAPLIGVAACLSLALWVNDRTSLLEFLACSQRLRDSRPTAVNLMNALDRMNEVAEKTEMDLTAIIAKAEEIFEEDVALCLQMAEVGEALILPGDQILTHCNTGGLATVGLGTALGVIIRAHQKGKDIHVFVDETRPLLQGGRLTAWELEKAGVPYTLICDNMAAYLMAKGKVDKVFLGADRIAMNGDFANKIGTYNVAVLSNHHQVPFYTVAPRTTVDPECQTGAMIPVEERKASEVQGVFGSFGEIRWAPRNSAVYNPAFDVTPVDLVTGMVIDDQFFSKESLKKGELARLF